MKQYPTNKIRNIALTGHSGSGKTTLSEAFLYHTGVSNRMGSVEQGNTVSDYGKEEIKRQVSISTSIIPIEWQDKKINIIDTPGYFDFENEVFSALRASEASLIVVDATSGIEVGTEKVLNYTERIGLPRVVFINKMEKENANFNKTISTLREQYSRRMIPFTLTLGEADGFKGIIDVLNKKAYEYDGFERKEVPIPEMREEEVEVVYTEIAEAVAETDDALMEKYFEGEEFSHEELMQGIVTAVLNGTAVPVLAGSAATGAGIDILLDTLAEYMPSPDDERAHAGFRSDDGVERKMTVEEPFSAAVFKTISDPFVGKISIFKVLSGSLKNESEVLNSSKNETEKINNLFYVRGKEQIKTDEVVAGDIAAIAKLSYTDTGDSLSDPVEVKKYRPLAVHQPTLFVAIEPKSKGDEDKIGTALHRLNDEDPSFVVVRNAETRQLTLGGQGNVQIQVILDRLREEYGVDTEIVPLRIAYRETIKGKSDVQGRHKKQSGGAGQYGDVHIRFEPFKAEEYPDLEIIDDFIFDEEVFGGAVPRNFFPAVEKGLRESIESGIIAGYPVVNVKATLYDGSYHPVDSNEMAFKMAAHIAFKKGMEEANPILLEPIMRVEVKIPEDYMGDIMGDMNKRRGRILGMEPQEDGSQLVLAEAPHSELFEYAIDLRSMTQARGEFKMEFDRYEEVPHDKVEKIIEEAKELYQ